MIVKYFSINDLLKGLNLDKFESPEELLNSTSLKNHPQFEQINEFISIQNKETNVFNGWIEQHPSLKDLLILGTTSDYFQDTLNWSQHALFYKFKFYVSAFLDELIQRKNDSQINSEWAKIFSFFVLLEDEKRYYLEQNLYRNIDSIIRAKLSQTPKNIDETDFHQILIFLLADDCIAIHNYLSRSSHSLKVSFIEQILRLFFHPKCTAKLAHWMILRLEKMELNTEQNQSLEQIKSKIKSGEIEFLSKKKKTNISRKRVALLVISMFCFTGILVFLYNQEFVANVQNFKEASSLTAFSIAERKEIDSVLKSMTPLDSVNETYFSSGNSITIQNRIKNKLAAKIYKELEQDMTNHFMQIYDTCIPLDKDKFKSEKITQTQKLNNTQGDSQIEFKNDSEYAYLILAWEESENGKVFSGFISQKSIFKMKVVEKMNLLLIPGNSYGPIPSNFKLEFSCLDNHFCSIDFNYEFALQQIHTVVPTSVKLSRVLLEGALGEVIIMTDADGILN